jgi:hypothetical protein
MDDPAAHARQARSARAAILRELGDGTRSLRITLRTPPSDLKTCKLDLVLGAAKNMGPVGVYKTCEAVGVWPTLPLGSLNQTTRQMLIDNLPKRAK